MVDYTSDGISNQEETKWLSWSIDGGLRGFDLERNPGGLSNTMDYGAGEFPLPTKSPTGTGIQSSSKTLSIIQSLQTEESYLDLGSLKRELERVQRKRDQANLDRDNVILEQDLLKEEREQDRKLQESTASCDQMKSELEWQQRKQQGFASGRERKMKTSIEPLMARSRSNSGMEVYKAPRSDGRSNLDCVAPEQMIDGLDTLTPPEPVPFLRNLETGRIKPRMDIALPGLTTSSTKCSQAGAVTSRLKELQGVVPRNRHARLSHSLGGREYPVRSAMIANYKKNTDGAYHR